MPATVQLPPNSMKESLRPNEAARAARNKRIEAHLRLVKLVARRIQSRSTATGIPLEDLLAYGAKGLVEAADRFDGRDIPFAAFARRRIYGAILDGIRAQHWFGRRADRSLRIERAGQDWNIEFAPAGQGRNDTRRNGRPMVQLPLEQEDTGVALVAIGLRNLRPPERRIVELCYREGKTLSQAAREIGISLPWASRLRARALANLRAAVNQSPSLPPQSPPPKRQPDGWPTRKSVGQTESAQVLESRFAPHAERPVGRQKRRAVP